MTEPQLGSPVSEKTSTGLEQNTAALLSYLFTSVTGLIFYIIEKDNKYVRFHAVQSILFGIALFLAGVLLIIINTLLNSINIPFIPNILAMFLSFAYWIGSVIVWILLMVKAFQGERYKLPFIGDIAERNV
ncbi:MAG: DUF4870 domain-containing protein [Actinomycetota bacterium]